MAEPRIPAPVLEAARRGVARMVRDTMRIIEEKTENPAERWRVLCECVRKMERGEV